MSEHFSWQQLSKQAEKWGREFDTISEGVGKVGVDKLQLGALLRVACSVERLTKFGDLLEGVVDGFFRKRCRKEDGKIDKEFYAQLADRAEKHGECPKQLMRTLYHDFCGRAASRFLWTGEQSHCWIIPPPKHHPLRKEYDNWMRRKAPKQKAKQD